MKRQAGKNILVAAIAFCVSLGAVQFVGAQQSNGNSDEMSSAEKTEQMISPSGEMIQPNWKNKPLKDVIEELSILSSTNIQVDESVNPETKVSFMSPVPIYWKDVMDKILEKNDLISRRAGPRQLEVLRPKRVNMEIRDSEFVSIIDTLAKIAGVSIIVSPSVASKNVSIPQLTLNDVPWQTALETVVKTAGFSTVREDYGVIRVITTSELRDQLETRTFQLRYLRPPTDTEAEVESTYLDQEDDSDETIIDGPFDWSLMNMIETFMTKQGDQPIGSLQYEEDRNILVVKDTPHVLRKIENILDVLDNEPPQVLIQVRFISTSNSFLRDLGLELDTPGNSMTGQQPGTELASSDAAPPNNQESTQYPFSFGSDQAGGTIGPYLSQYTLDWTLRMFQQDDQTRLLQSPRLTVVDGQKATVFVGEEIRFGTVETQQATAGSSTVSQTVQEAEFSPVEEGFQLYVIPNVVRGTDRIMMTVIPKNSTVDPQANTISINGGDTTVRFPTTTTSTVVTRLILKSGTTAVLAGLVNQNERAVKRSIPFLGDLPVLEYMFGAEGKTRSKSSDFFFITAHILPSVEEEKRRITSKLEARKRKAQQKFDDSVNKSQSNKSLQEQLRERQKSLEKEFENIKQSGEK